MSLSVWLLYNILSSHNVPGWRNLNYSNTDLSLSLQEHWIFLISSLPLMVFSKLYYISSNSQPLNTCFACEIIYELSMCSTIQWKEFILHMRKLNFSQAKYHSQDLMVGRLQHQPYELRLYKQICVEPYWFPSGRYDCLVSTLDRRSVFPLWF